MYIQSLLLICIICAQNYKGRLLEEVEDTVLDSKNSEYKPFEFDSTKVRKWWWYYCSIVLRTKTDYCLGWGVFVLFWSLICYPFPRNSGVFFRSSPHYSENILILLEFKLLLSTYPSHIYQFYYKLVIIEKLFFIQLLTSLITVILIPPLCVMLAWVLCKAG